MPEDSVTIMLQTEDDTETILEKVRRAGAKKVSLIVPPGTRALQTLGGFTMLRKACDITGLEVTVYSTDEKTADMAKVCRFEVVRLDQEIRPREATLPEEEEELPRIVVSPRPPEPAAAVISEAAPSGLEERLGSLSADDLALFDALETMSMSEDVELRPETLRRAAAAAAEPPPERAAMPAREQPARERPARQKSALSRFLEPVGSALSNVVMAVIGLFLNVASRVTQRKAAVVEAEAAPAVALPTRTDEESHALRSSKLRYYLWAGIGVVGFTLLLILFYALSQPTVIVALTPREAETQQMDLSLTIVMTDSVQPGAKAMVEGDMIAVQAKPVQVELSDQATSQATGHAIVPDTAATGVVVLTNPLCGWAVTVPANTRVTVAGGGIVFYTTQEVVVPAFVDVGSGAQVGIAQVSIIAESLGSAGNVDAWAINTIEEPSGCIKVRNEVATTGGSEHEATIITAADQEHLRQQLVDGLRAQAQADLQKQVGNLEILSGTLEVVTLQEDFSPALGDEATRFTLTARVRAQALAGTPGALNEAVEKAAEQKMGGAKAGREIGDITHGELVAGQPGINANVWTYHTRARVPLLTIIDDALKSEIANALSGKTPREASLVMDKYRDRIASFSISPVIDGVLGSVQVVDASQVKK